MQMTKHSRSKPGPYRARTYPEGEHLFYSMYLFRRQSYEKLPGNLPRSRSPHKLQNLQVRVSQRQHPLQMETLIRCSKQTLPLVQAALFGTPQHKHTSVILTVLVSIPNAMRLLS